MRRPLCLLALLWAVSLWILMCFMPAYEDPFAELDGMTVTLAGRVVSKEYKAGTNTWSGEETLTLCITLDHIALEPMPMGTRDRVLLRVPVSQEGDAADAMTPIGAYIKAQGTLAVFSKATNSGGFDAQLYYRTLGYRFQVQRATVLTARTESVTIESLLYQFRQRLHRILYQCCVCGEDADILAAMLLGEKGGLSQEIRDLYQSAGIIHILAISGLHIEIIGMGCYRLLTKCRLPHRPCAVLAGQIMLVYGLMTGMSASSIRALIMFLLHLIARSMHRTYDLLSALSAAGILLLVSQPLYLYHAGFQFSFGAVLAIGLLTPILPADILDANCKRILRQGQQRVRRRLPGNARREAPLPRISLQGLAATIGTYPVNLLSYGTFPLYSVALNALVLPLMGLVMVLGLLLLGGGLLAVPLGRCAAWPVHYLLYFYRTLCCIVAALPGHIQVLGHPEEWQIVAFFVLMGVLIFVANGSQGSLLYGKRRAASKEHRRRGEGGLPFVILLVWILAAMMILLRHPAAGLRIHVIDVGQGDGIFMECDGANILIDGGSTDQSDVARYDLLPLLDYYGAETIDLAMMTHEDEDHMNGLLSLLLSQEEHGIRIRKLALPDIADAVKGDRYRAVEDAAAAAGTEILYLRRGLVVSIGKLTMTVLHPEGQADYTEPNEASMVCYLTYGAFTALFTGDLEGKGEADCIRYVESRRDLFPQAGDENPASVDQVTLLKTAHHGSRGATTSQFLADIHPLYAVISCGTNNRYGHPHQETLERLAATGAQILDTRESGEITLSTDGRSMRIQTFLDR